MSKLVKFLGQAETIVGEVGAWAAGEVKTVSDELAAELVKLPLFEEAKALVDKVAKKVEKPAAAPADTAPATPAPEAPAAS